MLRNYDQNERRLKVAIGRKMTYEWGVEKKKILETDGGGLALMEVAWVGLLQTKIIRKKEFVFNI